MRRLALVFVLALSSCAALDTVVDVLGPGGEKVGTTTVGEIVSGPVSDVAGAVVGGLTGNPVIATGVSAAVAAAFLSARRRRKVSNV